MFFKQVTEWITYTHYISHWCISDWHIECNFRLFYSTASFNFIV